MAENKTKPTEARVEDYLAAIGDEARRKDCEALAALMARVTREPARMWGPSIVGFGSYHYKYASGHEGDSCVVGFSSRKDSISVYGLRSAADADALLARLGKHKEGKGCVYLKTLADVDLDVLEALVSGAAAGRAEGS
jgi:hypothetical protein